MSTGMARGAAARGKRVAFGNGEQIVFSPWSEQVFRYNPNIAHPGDEGAGDIEWIAHHKGNRLYNKVSPDKSRWLWSSTFAAQPGEIFFSDEELEFAERVGSGFVLIEPNVPRHKSIAANKDWGAVRYEAVAQLLAECGYRVVQLHYQGARARCSVASRIYTPTFRHALAILGRAALYIGPEGGLHHGAAAEKRRAVDGSLVAEATRGVILFGGFIPPSVTGYDVHTNLTGGATACGKLKTCRHCIEAMSAISVEKVYRAALKQLGHGDALDSEHDQDRAYQAMGV